MRINEGGDQFRQLTHKARGLITKAREGVPRADRERALGENRVGVVALVIEPGPPGNSCSHETFLVGEHLCTGRAFPYLSNGRAFIRHMMVTLFSWCAGIWCVHSLTRLRGWASEVILDACADMKSALVYLRRTSETSVKLRSIVSSHIAHSGPTDGARGPGETDQSREGAGLPRGNWQEVRISSR